MRPASARKSVLLAAAPLLCLALASPASPRPAAIASVSPEQSEFDQTVRPFFEANCISCHSAQAATAGLNLEAFRSPSSIGDNPEVWENIVKKITANQMPPPAMPRPDGVQAKAVTTWIERELDRAASRIKPEPGRVTARRLNRAEYDNTIRDLLGVDFHPAADFPQDDSGYGFDNNGDVLSLSPLLMEQYLNAAEKIARTAVYGPERVAPSLAKVEVTHGNVPESPVIPAHYDLTGLSQPNASHANYRFPIEGDYSIRVSLKGRRAVGAEPMHLALWLDGRLVRRVDYTPSALASFDGNLEDIGDHTVEFPKLHVTAGDHWIAATMLRMYEGLPTSFGGPNPSTLPQPAPGPVQFPFPKRFLVPPPDATPAQIAAIEARKKAFLDQRALDHANLPNASRFGSFLIDGPYNPVTGPSTRSKALLYTCGHLDGHHKPGCARIILTNLARRAFRRPLRPHEVDRYVALVDMAQKQGASFNEGLCVGIEAILVSPDFLFRIEHDPATVAGSAPVAAAHPVNQYELASRLSYFLWSSMPDEELEQVAAAGRLRDPATLHHEALRMLADPRARTLAENFAGQWLELRKLESVTPDLDKFPDYDEYVRMSMRQETETFFDHIARGDGSILDFLDANYSYLNERLANYYGVPGVHGPEFRRVDLSGTNRGGILTQASILTVSSYATRTSPVLRGKWVLENLLNTPPPPPPPNVPALEQTKVAAGVSLRKQLEQHRANPLCASCHSRMDPLGFALENFDAVGCWRDIDGKAPIDSSGRLPDGRTFHGPKELETILTGDRDAFTVCLTDKLLTYALGRGLERYDQPTVKTIAARVAHDNYHFSSLVLGIVDSLPFQQRKGA